MKTFFKKLWHEFWYKCYHLSRAVKHLTVNPRSPKQEAYHVHHFERAYYHAMAYEKLDPIGAKKYANYIFKRAFNTNRDAIP